MACECHRVNWLKIPSRSPSHGARQRELGARHQLCCSLQNGSGSRRPSWEQRSASACQRSSSNREKIKRQVASSLCCCQWETTLASEMLLLCSGIGKALGNMVHLSSPQSGQHVWDSRSPLPAPPSWLSPQPLPRHHCDALGSLAQAKTQWEYFSTIPSARRDAPGCQDALRSQEVPGYWDALGSQEVPGYWDVLGYHDGLSYPHAWRLHPGEGGWCRAQSLGAPFPRGSGWDSGVHGGWG